MFHKTLVCALALTLSALTLGARAEVLAYQPGQSVNPQDVARILDRSAAPERILTRSIRLTDATPAAPAAAPALSLPVQFGFDSATILPAAKDQLDSLAEGIKLLPSAQAVVIEGHTDARGGEDYNLDLSYRRAAAVQRYLVTVHGIEPTRLKPQGMGKLEPLDARDPFAAQNRRVQFHGA